MFPSTIPFVLFHRSSLFLIEGEGAAALIHIKYHFTQNNESTFSWLFSDASVRGGEGMTSPTRNPETTTMTAVALANGPERKIKRADRTRECWDVYERER